MKKNPADPRPSQAEKRRHSHYSGFRWRDLLLVPNLLSLSRILWTIPALVLILSTDSLSNDLIAAAFLAIAFLTDVLDGAAARIFKQISDLGKILDPIIDKVVVLSCAIALSIAPRPEQLPLWFVLAILVRDGFILLLSSMVLREDKYLFTSSWSGKVTTFMIACTLLAYLMQAFMPFRILKFLPYITLILLVFSGIDYLEKYWSVKHKRFSEMKSRGKPPD